MKKITVFLMSAALMGTMSCNNSQKVDTEALCAERVAAAVQAATDSIMSLQQKAKKTIVCRAAVKKGSEAAFAKLASALVDATRQEPGNISYSFYQAPGESTSFIFYEEYKDAAAFDAHASSAHFKAFADGIKDLLAEDLNIEQY